MAVRRGVMHGDETSLILGVNVGAALQQELRYFYVIITSGQVKWSRVSTLKLKFSVQMTTEYITFS